MLFRTYTAMVIRMFSIAHVYSKKLSKPQKAQVGLEEKKNLEVADTPAACARTKQNPSCQPLRLSDSGKK